jgi:hypothetical protein
MKKIVILIVVFNFIIACSGNPSLVVNEVNNSEWSIPKTEVFDGGPGKDGIPALLNPEFTTVEDSDFNLLKDTDLVIGYKKGDDVRAYPHVILDWHEIINDNIGELSLAVTYCPLTGTGIGWNRFVNGAETSFGVSGLLYNTNLIPFDRATGSNWAQILNESVNGNLIGEKVNLIQLFETNWKTWKILYPKSKVVSKETGFSRSYGVSPYGDYNTNNESFLFPVSKDNRLPLKERVHSIIDEDKAKSYRFDDFIETNIIEDSFEGNDYLIVGNKDFIVSFLLDVDKSSLEFNYIYNGTEVIINDNEGNEWGVFGEAISGPRKGEVLASSNSFMGFWFSIPAFYTTEIYSD